VKPAPFAYVRPNSLDDVLAELADPCVSAKILAGGQSLVPVLAMRLSRPAAVVDITAVPELDVLTLDGATLRIGAATRQRVVEHSAPAAAVPLLGMALPFVGHRELRSRGTLCGSLAHADPAAELPAVVACLDGVVEIAGPQGRRRVPAAEFWTGAMTTALDATEVLVAVELPAARPGEGHGFAELARRHGDFALAGVVARVRCDPAGAVTGARLTAFGVSDRPRTLDVTAAVEACGGAEAALRDALGELLAPLVDTAGDGHASTAYRRRLLRVLGARELGAACRRARDAAAAGAGAAAGGGAGAAAGGGAGAAAGGGAGAAAGASAGAAAGASAGAAAGASAAAGAGMIAGFGRSRPDVAATSQNQRSSSSSPAVAGPALPSPAVAGPALPAPTRVEAHQRVAVRLSVNGAAASVTVDSRTHLADTLRDQLRLTGTHLGCEHGVCGMCTVLVDGAAARSCLMFTVQCAGAQVVTVEGLGSAQRPHPLQHAFSTHHALQCGFCTPGMLMSAYDLLSGPASVPGGPGSGATLAEQMSGVLCRCTGYRGILAAVEEVAAAHPQGVPAPLGCRPRVLVGHGPQPGAAPAPPAPSPAGSGSAPPQQIRVPTGAPTARVVVTSALGEPPEAVWQVLDDPRRLVGCLPNAELLEMLDGDRYRGRARVALGPVQLVFDGVAQTVERDAAAHRMRLRGQGADRSGSTTQAEIVFQARPRPDGGTTLHAEADLYLSGRIAQFGRALADDVGRRMFEQFAAAVDESARTGAPPARTGGGAALRLALGVLAARCRRAVGALLTRRRRRG